MDVLILYCDSGAPSRWLRFLEAGTYHQVLADNQLAVASRLIRPEMSPEQFLELFKQNPARFLAVMFDEFNAQRSLRFVSAVRQAFPMLPLCAFGPYPALSPDTCIQHPAIDFLIIGEGEIALYELITLVLQGGDIRSVKNLWYRANGRIERNPLRPLQENLDLLPYPDRSLFAQDPANVPFSEKALYVAASRGCPYECQFCYSPVLKRIYSAKGSYYRIRTAQNLVAEILSELRRQPYQRLVFADEMFPADRMWLRDFAKKMGPAQPPPGEVVIAADKCDVDILDQLHTAGIRRLVLGLETGNDAFRRRIAARNHGNDRIEAVAALARERGMAVVTTNIIGLPLESAPLAEETYNFNKALNPDEIRCTVYQPIEGTPLAAAVGDRQVERSSSAAGPDFSSPSLKLADFSPEAVRQQLYKIRFLDLLEKLRAVPRPSDALCFLTELPKARFKLARSRSMNVGATERNGRPYVYLALETGSECRYALSIPPRAVMTFGLSIAEAALQMAHSARSFIVAEVVWEPEAGEPEILFSRMIQPKETRLAAQWRDCVVFGPEQGSKGQIVIRVRDLPHAEAGAYVFWGNPVLTTSANFGAASSQQAGLQAKLDAAEAETATLLQELAQVREAEREIREERDRKSQRVGELQIRVVELEKQLEEQMQVLRELQATEGLGGKLKGLFRK